MLFTSGQGSRGHIRERQVFREARGPWPFTLR
jgi:hypothetical protein